MAKPVSIGTSGRLTETPVDVSAAGVITLPGINAPTLSAGSLAYDTATESPVFKNNEADVTLQIGQENWVRVSNVTGATIPNGSAVYINGMSSGLPSIALAQANAAATVSVAGLATHPIETGTIGYITAFGAVRGIDTSTFAAGAVFLSATTPGGLTQTTADNPNYRFRVGSVSVVNAVTGVVNVQLGVATKGEEVVVINPTSNYTFVLADFTFNTDVNMTVATANNVTIPPNSSVNARIGAQAMITWAGAGQTTIVAGAGVTIRNPNLKLRAQYSKCVVEQVAINVWDVTGDMEVADTLLWKNIIQSSGSHIAARVAGTYGFGQGDPAAISGTGTLYPLHIHYILSTEYPASAKLRVFAHLFVNDVAPTGNYTMGLYPITRPGTSGGAGLNIYTLGTVVSGSQVAFTAPAADSMNVSSSAEFSVPTTGYYVLGMITTAAVATSSHLHIVVKLQVR